MLFISDRKADEIEYILFVIYMDAKQILSCAKEYNNVNNYGADFEELMFNKYVNFFSSALGSFQYMMIIGSSKLVDKNNNSISIKKLLNKCEQLGISKLNKIIKEYRNQYDDFASIINIILEYRDKVFAHADFKYNYDDNFDFAENIIDSDIWKKIESFIEWTIKMCVEISKEYNGDEMMLRYNNSYGILTDELNIQH